MWLVERLGVVYIAIELPTGADGSRFIGYWDRADPPELLEQGPGWDDVEEAIAWGRERAPRVLVRVGNDESSIYSAGELPLTRGADGSVPAYPEWPPAGRS